MLDKLAQDAALTGWDRALYHYNAQLIREVRPAVEDQRSTDWQFYLPVTADSTALVLGCGLGAVPIALASRCRKVVAVDSSSQKIKFLSIRKQQQGINNLETLALDTSLQLPFDPHTFDLVVLMDPIWFKKNERKVFEGFFISMTAMLKSGGYVFLNLNNTFSLSGYRSLLSKHGFKDITFYAPLPGIKGIPMFYLPLNNTSILKYFFENIFPLFDMVSPEVKKIYGWRYKVAKAAVAAARRLDIIGLIKFFVPGYSVMARRS